MEKAPLASTVWVVTMAGAADAVPGTVVVLVAVADVVALDGKGTSSDTMAPVGSAPTTMPERLAGTPPKRASMPLRAWPAASVNWPALAAVRLDGYHSRLKVAPLKLIS